MGSGRTCSETVFVDDVNGGDELDKHLVIEARKTEMEFFKNMAVCLKFPKSEVKKQGGKIISTRWVDTDKGYREKRELSLEACRQGNQGRQASGSVLGHPAARDFRVACGRLCQRSGASQAFEDWNLRREQGVLVRARDAASLINIPDEDWEEGDEGLVGQLQISLYGTRDAAQNWAATYTKFLVKIWFQRDTASNCNFVHRGGTSR